MVLPTLNALGMNDKRRKIPDEVKEHIKEDLKNGKTNLSALAREYGVSVCTVRMIRNPEHEKELIRKSRRKKNYYNHYKQKMWNKDLQERKRKRIYELLEEQKAV